MELLRQQEHDAGLQSRESNWTQKGEASSITAQLLAPPQTQQVASCMHRSGDSSSCVP